MGAGTLYFLTVQGANAAGVSATYDDALAGMEREVNKVTNSGFGQFAKLTPVAGYSGCGADLYVIENRPTASKIGPAGAYILGPNVAWNGWLMPNFGIYEYQVRTLFDVGPFVDMSTVPFIGNVPGLGCPVRLSFVAQRNVEYPGGLCCGPGGFDPYSGLVGGGVTGNGGNPDDGPGAGPVRITGNWTPPPSSGPTGNNLVPINGGPSTGGGP